MIKYIGDMKTKFVCFLMFFALGFMVPSVEAAPKKKRKKKAIPEVVATAKEKEEDVPEEDDRQTTQTERKSKAALRKEKHALKKKLKQERKQKQREERQKLKEQKQAAKEQKKAASKKGHNAADITAKQATSYYSEDAADYPPSKKQLSYRIDVLVPLYLDAIKNRHEAPSTNIPLKAFDAINFYKGIQMAVDTLKKQNFGIDIFVHDIASDKESVAQLLKSQEFGQTDLVIGLLTGNDIDDLSEFALQHQVNFVSVYSAYDAGIQGNPYVTLLQPSGKNYLDKICAHMNNGGANGKRFVLYRANNKSELASFNYLNSLKSFKPIVCNVMPTKQRLSQYFDMSGKNTLVVPTGDVYFVDSLLGIMKSMRTDFPNFQLTIYGMPSWTMLPNLLQPNGYSDFEINIGTPFIYEPKATKRIDQMYLKEYGYKPDVFVYRGYETLYWYAHLLRRYGTIFNNYYSDNETAPFTHFEVKPQMSNNGKLLYYENAHLYMHSYKSGNVTVKD